MDARVVVPAKAKAKTYRAAVQAVEMPYTYAIVELDEGVRVPANIVECAPEDLRVDMPVVAAFDDVSVEWSLVKFKPA